MSPLAPLAFTLAAMGAAGFAWLGLVIAWRGLRGWWRRGGRDMARITAEDAADTRPVTRPMDLGGLVISPEMERHAAWRVRHPVPVTRAGLPAAVCTRCATGDTRLPCACGKDCYAAECLGGLA